MRRQRVLVATIGIGLAAAHQQLAISQVVSAPDGSIEWPSHLVQMGALKSSPPAGRHPLPVTPAKAAR
jgi:hypothetical protein